MLDVSWEPEQAFRIMSDLDPSILPTALFVASDHLAMAVIAALRAKGISVPQDISVVGYDNAPGCDYFQPPLTTVVQNLPQVASQAIETLIDKIEKRPCSDVVRIPTALVQRASTQRISA